MITHNVDIRILRALKSLAETGSVTDTARALGRTQPAISLQLRRLCEICGCELFYYDGRRMVLNEDGLTVLSYATSILKMHDELLQRYSPSSLTGTVVLGVPDLYAAYLLPTVLAQFRSAFPGVRVQLNCSLSAPLLRSVYQGDVDLALVTRMKDFSGGRLVRQEQLVWVTGEGSRAEAETPVPLALLPPGNIYRDHAIDSLTRAGKDWRVVCQSESVSGLQAAIFAGMAVTVLGMSAKSTGMREIAPGDALPALPKVDLLLYKAANEASEAVNTLHDYLAEYLSTASIEPAL